MRKALFGALALSFALPLTAQAASDVDPNGRLDLLIGHATGPESSYSISPLLHIYVPFSGVAVSLDWGVSDVIFDTPAAMNYDKNQFKLLNPTIATHTTFDFSMLKLRVGIGFGIPLAKAESPQDWAAYWHTSAAQGLWNPWMTASKTFSVVLPVRTEIAVSDSFYIAAEGAAFAMMGVTKGAQTNYGLQGAAEGMFPLGLVDVGVRLQGVWFIGDKDLFQGAVGPMVKLQLGPAFVDALLLLNLDEPFGPSFKDGSSLGLRVGAGLNF